MRTTPLPSYPELPKFTKPSEVWYWADKNLQQIRYHLYLPLQGYCAIGAIGHCLGLPDDELTPNLGVIHHRLHEVIWGFDSMLGLTDDLRKIFGHNISDLNDLQRWTFKDFAIVSEMLGY